MSEKQYFDISQGQIEWVRSRSAMYRNEQGMDGLAAIQKANSEWYVLSSDPD